MADETSGDDAGGGEPSGGLMKTLISGLGIFVLVLAAAVIAPLINNAIYGPPEVAAPAAEGGGSKGAGEKPMVDPSALEPALYQPLEPPLVVAFEAADGATRYLQMSVQVMARDQAAIDAVKTHAPAIRNNFLFLIGNREYASLGTVAGKEKLRSEMLDEVRAIMQRNTGDPGVEEVYFTSFVMQ